MTPCSCCERTALRIVGAGLIGSLDVPDLFAAWAHLARLLLGTAP